MRTFNPDAQGYKSPVCKVVLVHVEGLICSSLDGYTSTVDTDGVNDLDEI